MTREFQPNLLKTFRQLGIDIDEKIQLYTDPEHIDRELKRLKRLDELGAPVQIINDSFNKLKSRSEKGYVEYPFYEVVDMIVQSVYPEFLDYKHFHSNETNLHWIYDIDAIRQRMQELGVQMDKRDEIEQIIAQWIQHEANFQRNMDINDEYEHMHNNDDKKDKRFFYQDMSPYEIGWKHEKGYTFDGDTEADPEHLLPIEERSNRYKINFKRLKRKHY